MSKRHKNKATPEKSAIVVPQGADARTETGVAGTAESVVRLFQAKEIAFNMTSMRAASNKKVHLSAPGHSEHIIRRRAYELYEKRGREDGHAEEDWLRAEAEVLGSALRKAKVG